MGVPASEGSERQREQQLAGGQPAPFGWAGGEGKGKERRRWAGLCIELRSTEHIIVVVVLLAFTCKTVVQSIQMLQPPVAKGRASFAFRHHESSLS